MLLIETKSHNLCLGNFFMKTEGRKGGKDREEKSIKYLLGVISRGGFEGGTAWGPG